MAETLILTGYVKEQVKESVAQISNVKVFGIKGGS